MPANRVRMMQYWRTVDQILARCKQMRDWGDTKIRERALEIRWQARGGIAMKKLLVESYALVREASRRATGKEHYPVQLLGGIVMFHGHIAEMQTGEGKTLTATLPAFLRALPGRGCHVITVNDYLAQRDAESNEPIYEQLGLTVGCILTDQEDDDRRENYKRDITYGTAKEFGFDFLRDRLKIGGGNEEVDRHRPFGTQGGAGEQPVQRGQEFALIDEADSILIDEARTPLIIGLSVPQETSTVELLRWCRRTAPRLTPNQDFIFEPDRRSVYLTDAGCRHVVLMPKPLVLDGVDTETIYEHVERAMTAELAFKRDRDYVIQDDEVVIVDEGTGRLMDGRKWQDGLHQAVEAKELLPITSATGQAARVTVQTFFRRYRHLAGMTGTAVQARRELRRGYKLSVSVIPTHRPCLREGLPNRVFATQAAKWQAILEEVQRLIESGRAILCGTPSVHASEALSAILTEKGIEHEVLNAYQHEREASIVGKAGEKGRVTIATNMAGRGTDIILDEHVRKSGGLHVIATEFHSSKRIDRQLVGRAARQGDPGSFQFFLSLEDELLRCLPDAKVMAYRASARPNAQGEISGSWVKMFRRTQRFLEKQHSKQRKGLLKAEKERHKRHREMGLDPFLELTE